MKITPIQFNNYKKVSFKENNLNNLTPNQAVLALQNPNAGVNFEKDFKITHHSDAVQANPILALGYKLYKTYKMIFNPELKRKPLDMPNDYWVYQSVNSL